MLQCCFDRHGNFDNEQFSLLAARLDGMIKGCIKNYYLPGGEREDLYQWGLWGLYKAVLYYDEADRYSFDFVAKRNIQNMIKSAVTRANRQKHKLDNAAESLYCRKTTLQNDNLELIERLVIAPNLYDPLAILVDREAVEDLYRYIRLYLSEHERLSIQLYLAGYPQRDIAQVLNIGRKVVDNAIQRAKKKIAQFVISENTVLSVPC